MSKPVEIDTGLLTEHFGYRPTVLLDDIINSVNTRAFAASAAVENAFLNAGPAGLGFRVPARDTPEGEAGADAVEEMFRYEVENGVHQLETLLEAKIDRNFDKMEIFMLRNYLSIPPEVRGWIRMHHYEGLNLAPPNPDAPSSESITLQRRKVRETQKLHSLLLAESARNAATIASLKGLLIPNPQQAPSTEQEPAALGPKYPVLGFLQERGNLTGDSAHPLGTTTSFALSQLPALKSLLENLEPRLKELRDGGVDGKAGFVGEAEKSWRRERLEFIETETRKHLEYVRGLELGEMGEVRDGEWQGEGRKLMPGEVRDLERIVGLVSGEAAEKIEGGE